MSENILGSIITILFTLLMFVIWLFPVVLIVFLVLKFKKANNVTAAVSDKTVISSDTAEVARAIEERYDALLSMRNTAEKYCGEIRAEGIFEGRTVEALSRALRRTNELSAALLDAEKRFPEIKLDPDYSSKKGRLCRQGNKYLRRYRGLLP